MELLHTMNGKAMLGHNNVNEEIDKLVKDSIIVDYKFTLIMQCEIQSEDRDLMVSVNDDVVFDGAVKSGRYEFDKEIKIPPGHKAIIKAKSNTHRHGDKIIINDFIQHLKERHEKERQFAKMLKTWYSKDKTT